MKKLLISLAVLLLLLVGAALVAPGFVDWNHYKADIAAEAEKVTGRRLAIDGDLSFAVLPAPVLQARDVRLANIEGGSEPEMLTLESLDIRVSLLPLLGGRLQVNSVSLVSPRILLEVLADGRTNWELDPPEITAPMPSPESPAAEPVESAESSEGVEPAEAPPVASEGATTDGDFTVQVDNFSIEDGLLVYRDAASGDEERIESIDARIVAESLRGPFAVEGEARLRGLRTTIEAAAGRLPDAGAATLNATLGVPDAEAQAQFTGSLSRHPTSVELRGKIKGEGGNLATLLSAARLGSAALPMALGNPFNLEAVVEADPGQIEVSELRFGLGDDAVEGSGKLMLEPSVDARLKLTATHLDLDALLAGAAPDEPGEGPQTGEAPEPMQPPGDDAEGATDEPSGGAESAGSGDAATPLARSMEGFSLPSDVEASIQLGVDALVYREQVVRQIRLNATLSQGRLEINQAMALLPGGSDFSLTGAGVADEQGPRFGGHLEAASDNLRGVLEWLGADLSAVPADRLRKTSLSTRIAATPTQLNLSELDLRVDVSRLAGGVVAALRDRPGLGIGLALDNLNLDGYLPRPGVEAMPAPSPTVKPSSGDADEEPEEAAADEEEAQEGEQAPGSPGPLDAFDANLNLRIGSLVYGGQTARDISVEGTLQDGALSFKQLLIADLAGSALSYSGALGGLGESPELDGLLDLRIADPVKLARMAGFEDPVVQRLGPFNLTGNVKGSLDGLGFNSKLALLGGRFGLAGTARPLASPPVFDVVLEADHPDLVRLADSLAGATGLGAGLGGLDVKARIAGDPARLSISEIAGQVGPANLSGSLGLALDGGGFSPQSVNLGFHLKHGSLAALSGALGGPSLSAELGGIDLRGQAAGEGGQFKLSELSGVAGPLGISGELEAGLTAGQPTVGAYNLNLRLKHGSLAAVAAAAGASGVVAPSFGGVDLGAHVFGNAQRIDLRDLKGSLGSVALDGTASVDLSGSKPFVAADLTTSELSVSSLLAAAAGGGTGSGGAGGTGAGSISPRWSAQALDLSALQEVNADVKLRAPVLSYERLRLNDADLAALLTDGRLELQRLTGRIHGGEVQANGSLDANGVPSVSLAFSAAGVESGTLLVELARFERMRGPVTLNANLTSQGRSEAELVSQLGGQGDIAGTLTVSAKTEEAVGAALLNLLGQEVKEVRGVASGAGGLLQAFAGTPSRLSGTFSINGGVASTTDLRLDGRDAVALTRGQASLPAWVIDSRTEVTRSGGGSPFITADLSGPLDEPNVRVGGDVFQRRQQPAAQPQGDSEGGGGQPQPEPQQAPTPEDLLKGLLKKLN